MYISSKTDTRILKENSLSNIVYHKRKKKLDPGKTLQKSLWFWVSVFGSKQCALGTHVAGAWTERQKMFLGGSFFKLADDNKYIKNPEAQNREVRGF